MLKVRGKKVSWIDILKPTKSDIEGLKKIANFHPIILDELLHLSARSRVESYDHYLFLTYHFPFYDRSLKTSRKAEIDFLITKDHVITIHYEALEPIEAFSRSLSNNTHFKELAMNISTGRFVYYLIQEIIHFSLRQLKPVEESIGYITQEIFKGRETEILEKISYTKRDVLDFQIISRSQEILLNSLAEVGLKFWGEPMEIYLSDLSGDYSKVMQHLDNYREVIESLESTNSQLLSAKTNAVMQKFTIFAFLTFPIFLFTSLVSVDFIGDFVLASPMRFWGIFLAVGTIVVILVIIFKRRGWL